MDVEDSLEEVEDEMTPEMTPQPQFQRPTQRPYLDTLQQLRHDNNELRTVLQQLREACEREIGKRVDEMEALKLRTSNAVKMAWGHHDAMAEKLRLATRELALCKADADYLRDVESWQQRRIENLEQALVKCEKTRRAIFHDSRDDEEAGTFEPNKKVKTLHLVVEEEPRPQRKRRASRELDLGALGEYVRDGTVETTRELRQNPAMRCDTGWQRCHLVGLNLLKRVLNHYSQVRQLRLEPSTYAVLRAKANEDMNLQCCTPDENRQDTVTEAEVLRHMFEGEPLQSVEAKQMLQQLQSLLADVDSHSGGDLALATVLEELRQGKFPLQRRCFTCQRTTDGREPAPSTRSFCSPVCQRLWHDDNK